MTSVAPQRWRGKTVTSNVSETVIFHVVTAISVRSGVRMICGRSSSTAAVLMLTNPDRISSGAVSLYFSQIKPYLLDNTVFVWFERLPLYVLLYTHLSRCLATFMQLLVAEYKHFFTWNHYYRPLHDILLQPLYKTSNVTIAIKSIVVHKLTKQTLLGNKQQIKAVSCHNSSSTFNWGWKL